MDLQSQKTAETEGTEGHDEIAGITQKDLIKWYMDVETKRRTFTSDEGAKEEIRKEEIRNSLHHESHPQAREARKNFGGALEASEGRGRGGGPIPAKATGADSPFTPHQLRPRID